MTTTTTECCAPQQHGRHSADCWHGDTMPGLVYRLWLTGDPEHRTPRHAKPDGIPLTAAEPVPAAAQEWWAACFPQWTKRDPP